MWNCSSEIRCEAGTVPGSSTQLQSAQMQPERNRSISKTAILPVPAARAFEALTTPAEIIGFLPYDIVVSDELAEGATITFSGTIGGKAFADHGEVTQFDPPCTFAYRYWSDNHGAPNTSDRHHVIRYSFTPEANGTSKVAVEHAGLFSEEYFSAMLLAWDIVLEMLHSYLLARSEGVDH